MEVPIITLIAIVRQLLSKNAVEHYKSSLSNVYHLKSLVPSSSIYTFFPGSEEGPAVVKNQMTKMSLEE